MVQESVHIAKLYAYRRMTEEQKERMRSSSVHIHFLEASSKKDGCYGGVAVCTALLSLAKE